MNAREGGVRARFYRMTGIPEGSSGGILAVGLVGDGRWIKGIVALVRRAMIHGPSGEFEKRLFSPFGKKWGNRRACSSTLRKPPYDIQLVGGILSVPGGPGHVTPESGCF